MGRSDASGGARPLGILSPCTHCTAWACEPVTAPAPYRCAGGAQAARHLWGGEPRSQEQDDLGPETEVLGRGVGADHRVQRLALLL